MTNREYMESLSDEELGEFLDKEPWDEDCLKLVFTLKEKYATVITTWLSQEKE